MDGNADAEADGQRHVSLDDQWMVRYLDVDVDFQSVLDHRPRRTSTRSIRIATRWISSVTDDARRRHDAGRRGRSAHRDSRPRHFQWRHRDGTPKKKKKSHGGLKFMAFIVVLVVLIIGITKGSKTEMGQRITGNLQEPPPREHPIDPAVRVLRRRQSRSRSPRSTTSRVQ